nr:hypothetical protein NCPCFENI_00031 [Cupriavidus sp.]
MKLSSQKNFDPARVDRDSRLKFKAIVILGLILVSVWGFKAWGQQPAPGQNPAAAADAKPVVPSCLPVEGLTFTISGPETLLATRGTESVALIHTTMFLPAGLHELRFLASELCAGGPKAHFVVNHYLHTVQLLRFFEGPSNEFVARINPTGRSGTVPAANTAVVQTANVTAVNTAGVPTPTRR